jgi:hypothetical protein
MTHKCLNAHCERQTPPRRGTSGPTHRYCRECRTERIYAIARRNKRRRRGLEGDGTARALRVPGAPKQARVATNGSWWLHTPSPEGFTALAASQAGRMSASKQAAVVNAMEILASSDYGKERRTTFA